MNKLLAIIFIFLSVAAFAFIYRAEPDLALPENSAELQPRSCWFTPEAGRVVACFNLRVTEAGHHFTLPVVVLKSAQASNHAVLYLSGGPGGSTFLSAEDMIYWQGQYARFDMASDLVLVDRRGTGMAEPRLQCPYFRREYRKGLSQDLSAKEENAQHFRAMSWCFDKQLSSHPESKRLAVDALGTAADARDMQALLSLLGYQQWSLWGVSYGTRLALAMAANKPQGLQSLVLDSVYPPERGHNEEWPGLMSSAMTRFFHWCDTHHCSLREASVLTPIAEAAEATEKRFQQMLEQLDARPVQVSVPSWYGEAPYQVAVNGQRYLQIVFAAIYDQHLWPSIGESLMSASVQQRAALDKLAESFVNNAFDPDFSEMVFYAAECKDNRISDPKRVNKALSEHPYYSRYLEGMAGTDVCQASVLGSVRGREQLSVADLANIDVPVLLLSGEMDPITPIDWVEPLQALLPHWQLASFSQVGHAVVSSDICAEQLLRDFIAEPRLLLALADNSCLQSSITLSASSRLQVLNE
ncbi:alpha/beta fold hydrolase [Simiduia curdlanivorans]|uniref:Alpha/beta hydrolase n=1 Tax=Simiduia curdlanivorans TaxID=1492769 RepID=A0ABV8V1M6_9GAMM|nr:alpha/beta fold hydrolase [Simiduia curdlanivorans]MDN3640013.1 alpha/beta fold hydrolase [Simiduia curdlanivorans]